MCESNYICSMRYSSLHKGNHQELKAAIESSKKITIVVHQSPDGDAVGSALGLRDLLLRKTKGQVQVILPDADAPFLHWLPNHESVLVHDQEEEKSTTFVQSSDLIFTLDFNSVKRCGGVSPLLISTTAKVAMIDHHQMPEDYADFMLSDTSASSTCELIADFQQLLYPEESFTKAQATCLYVGLITDTGSFRYSSATRTTLRWAAHFLDIGVDKSFIYDQVFDQSSLTRLRLMGHALSSNLKVLQGEKTSLTYLKAKELERFNYSKGDTEGLVNYGLSIHGIQATAFVREEENAVKISFRSKGNVDVNLFARNHFNGGGHKNAAGAKSEMGLEKTLELIQKELPLWVEQY